MEEQYTSEKTTHRATGNGASGASSHLARIDVGGVDTQRLNTAMRILQSELSLADSQLSLSDNTDLLTQLYDILGPSGSHVDPIAMVSFNHRLAERLRQTSTIA